MQAEAKLQMAAILKRMLRERGTAEFQVMARQEIERYTEHIKEFLNGQRDAEIAESVGENEQWNLPGIDKD